MVVVGWQGWLAKVTEGVGVVMARFRQVGMGWVRDMGEQLRGLVAEWLCPRGVGRWCVRRLVGFD